MNCNIKNYQQILIEQIPYLKTKNHLCGGEGIAYFVDENFVIKITDEKLIETCGGIVQGMSGSPIIQNGKLVGAVTHVFLNNPSEGYGITAQNMVTNYDE